jgi:hypothetical protein
MRNFDGAGLHRNFRFFYCDFPTVKPSPLPSPKSGRINWWRVYTVKSIEWDSERVTPGHSSC